MPDATMPLNQRIGVRLRAARLERALSSQDLVDLTQGALNPSHIHQYEHGRRRLSVEDAEVLATALGNVTAAHLLCLDGSANHLSDEEASLLQAYRQSDRHGRETITAVARLLSLAPADGLLH